MIQSEIARMEHYARQKKVEQELKAVTQTCSSMGLDLHPKIEKVLKFEIEESLFNLELAKVLQAIFPEIQEIM